MNLTNSTSRRWLAAMLSTCVFSVILAAQTTARGVITGRVSNSTTGTYLNHAKITLPTTGAETFTGDDGRYRLENVPVGEAVIEAFFTGLERKTVRVVVTADTPAAQDF